MTDKKPTPIRKPLVPVPAPEPQPLVFPKPALTDEQLRNLVATLVARTMYRSVMRLIEPDIVTMTEPEFEAFCRSVLQEDA